MKSDKQFLNEFETKTLPAAEFDHVGHLRIAWIYLTQYSYKEAVELITHGIKTYALSLGATGKFHFTLTTAIVNIMAERMSLQRNRDFSCFLQHNQDLVSRLPLLIAAHYSADRLNSYAARNQFIPADKEPLPFAQIVE